MENNLADIFRGFNLTDLKNFQDTLIKVENTTNLTDIQWHLKHCVTCMIDIMEK